MAREDLEQDAAFAQRAVSSLPSVPVPGGLEARILADFDAVTARRRRSLAPGRLVRRWRDTMWPGAPMWKPAAVLALSLAVGLAAGAMVPSSAFVQQDQAQVSSLDTTTSTLEISGDL